MSRTSRLQNLQASKNRRMKMIAIGGAVLLAAILAFELPHYLGGSSSPSAAGTTSAPGSTTTGTATTATTAPGTAAAAVAVTASTKLPNSDVAPSRTKSQLSSFDTFAGKDPFVQQVTAQTATAGSGPSSGGPAASHPAAGSGAGSSQSAQQPSSRTLASRGVATIQVNGTSETVRVGQSFPSANPVFKLVSVANGAANIGIASGSYTSGAQTVRLTGGHLLTLVDTADGVRYKLRLLSAS